MIAQQLAANPANSQAAGVMLNSLSSNPMLMDKLDVDFKDIAMAQAYFQNNQQTQGVRAHTNLDDNAKALLVAEWLKKQQAQGEAATPSREHASLDEQYK